MENNEAKMKFTINGFNQEKLIKYGLDAVDALILRYFIDFKDSGDMVIEIINNKPYYWVRYSYLISTIPIINLKSKDALRRRLKKLEKCKVLIHYHKNQGGSYSYYGIGPNYKYLIKNDPTIQKSEGATQKSEGYDSKVGGATTQKSEQNINLLKDKSIKDNIYTKNFLEWYSLYPNKFNKDQTFKNFQKLLKKESYENLKKATKNYIAYIKTNKIEKKYIVRSSNFIGQKQVYKGYLEMNLESTETGIESSLNTLENMDLEGENASA